MKLFLDAGPVRRNATVRDVYVSNPRSEQHNPESTDSRGRTVAESKASDGVRYAGARIGVGRRVTERY